MLTSVTGTIENVPALTLSAVQQALTVVTNADGSYHLKIETANTEIGGKYFANFKVGLKDYSLPAEATGMTAAIGTFKVKFEIYDDCTEVRLSS